VYCANLITIKVMVKKQHNH